VTGVVDTSIVVKWFLAEEGSEAAETYLRALLEGTARLIAPSSLFVELASTLWVQRRNGLTAALALQMYQKAVLLPLQVFDTNDLLPAGLEAAYRYQISPYDAVFVVLARQLDCELITADRALWTKVREQLPWVKLLA
jgi:predicted nucleic acid-binding protein